MEGPQQGPVFVYGSLMAEEVLEVLLGRVPPSVPGTLRGYRRYAIVGAPYPGIIAEEGGAVVGKVFEDLSEREKAIFDEFEDGAYRKREVVVEKGEGASLAACVYVYPERRPPEGPPLADGPWDFDAFRRDEIDEYVAMCQLFMLEISKLGEEWWK